MKLFVFYFVFYIITKFGFYVSAQYYDLESNSVDSKIKSIKLIDADLYLLGEKYNELRGESVKIQVYYESLCPDCRHFVVQQLRPTVYQLGDYLDIKIYPYGNAKTIIDNNGQYHFECQHGSAECYGNKLHACAIELIGNPSTSVLYNGCMMDYGRKNEGSNDASADECAPVFDVDSEPIKQCAKGDRGMQLLKFYGDESKKIGFKYVPYILINGVENDGKNFYKDVCAAFKNPPGGGLCET